jgi:hypothetical protein
MTPAKQEAILITLWREGLEITIYQHVQLTGCSKNHRILLANLFPPSQANLSAWSSPRSCGFKVAVGEAQISTLPSSPTVSLRLWNTVRTPFTQGLAQGNLGHAHPL